MTGKPDGRGRLAPETPRRLVLTGGGTGGHLYPAVSIAQACSGAQAFGRSGVHGDAIAEPETLNAGTPECLTPVFIGSRTGLEAEVIAREGFEFHAVASRKVTRRLSPGTLVSLAVIGWGTVQAGLLLRRLQPAAVIGTGGYASAGVVLAAALQRIPTLIHEQNSIPGRTNRLLARLVRRVALTFPVSAAYFPAGKTVVTGLPIRPEITMGNRERGLAAFALDPGLPTLLVLGGSLGARSLNAGVLEALPRWSNSRVQILHQVGRGNWDEHRAALDQPPPWYHPVPYLDAMGDAYAVADLVLCRAGASTLAELTAVGLPAVLVPYPYAHADHQTHNARALVTAGAAVLVPDDELSGQRLAAEISRLLEDPARRNEMACASRSMGRPHAAQTILDEVCRLIESPAAAENAVQTRGEAA